MSASLGETAVLLPWLAPDAAALAACTRDDPQALQQAIENDPGMALLWARCGSPPVSSASGRAALIRLAINDLRRPRCGVLSDESTAGRRVLRAARQVARAAAYRAAESGVVDPMRAAVAGLLSLVGWQAVTAVDAAAAAKCLADGDFLHDSESVEIRHWGVSAAALNRRLARAWSLPDWLAAAIGNLDLPVELAGQVGGESALTIIVHEVVRQQGIESFGSARTPSTLNLDNPPAVDAASRSDPFDATYLIDLLTLALQSLERRGDGRGSLVERENESLRQALRDQQAIADERLQSRKLAALAEFAAGAGHEINNPLAVISGHAQYLLVKESEPDRQKSLQTIVHQAHRIHQILTGLMQFARPSKPQLRSIDLREVANAVATELHEFAALQRVSIELITPDEPCMALADPRHTHTALSALLRNAVEAAPADGWARVSVDSAGDLRRFIVEDSGDGPADHQRDHLFDPFFSGRQAGRGRGLGLPAAWRLAQEQGGDVRFEPGFDSPARFVLELPRADEAISVDRLSA